MPIWTGQGTTENWSDANNWDTLTVPNSTSDAIFNGVTGTNPNKNCTITSGANCRSLNCAGYAGTITFTNTLTVNMQSGAGQGDITFSAAVGFSMVGPNGIFYAGISGITRTLTTNGYNYNLPLTTSGGNSPTLTLVGNLQITNYTAGGANFNFNGDNLLISGNVTTAGIGGTSQKIFNGNGTMNNNCAINNLTINATGFTRTFSGTVTINNSLTWTAGTIVTTGSTIQLLVSTLNFPTTQPLNNVSIVGGTIYTMTILSDVYVAGNLSWGNGMVINGGKFLVQGNVTSGGGSGGSMVVEMTGTGTITNFINWLLIANSPSGTITFAANALMVGGFTYTSGTLNLANNLRITGPLVINNPVTVTGTGRLYFLNNLSANTTINVTSNGHSWPNDAEIQASGGGGNLIVTLNLVNDFRVLGNFFVSQFSTSTAAQTINNNTLFVGGNFTVTVPSGLNGTANIVLEGSSNSNLSATSIQNNLNINKTGVGTTVSILTSFTWGAANRTLQKTAGIINPGTSTITIPNNTSVTVSGMDFWNLTIPGASTTTQNTLNTIQNNLTLAATGNTAFTGSAGWTCANLICSNTNRTITLGNSGSGASYRTTTNASLTATAAAPILMTSNNATTRSLWTLDYGAQQQLIYVSGTRIDSSQGQTIWSFGAALTNTVNWATGSRPGTTAYTFVV
jgi:hypothetical protein